MWSFLVFNWGLPTVDVVTDLFNFLYLLPDHPRWAYLTLAWMFTSFGVHASIFFANRFLTQIKALWNTCFTRNTCNTCNTCNPCNPCIPCNNWKNFAEAFYKEAVIHFPGIATIHNLWKAWQLYKLKWGTKDFKTDNHKQVEKILADAGRCSHGESMYEAGPQAVTQVKYHQ